MSARSISLKIKLINKENCLFWKGRVQCSCNNNWIFWKSAMLKLKRWNDYRKAKLKNRVFLVFLSIRAVKFFFFSFRPLLIFFLFIILLLSLSAILQTMKKSLANFFRSTNLSANLIANSLSSINCWKFKIAYSLTRITILSISTQLYSLLIVQLKTSLITSTFIAKKISITSPSSNRFLFFCEAFMRTETRLTILEKSTKFLKYGSIKFLMSFF